jgi:energy-coupling factor transporter ATP-binding protein EcfA2
VRDLSERNPAELSGGELQRVVVAAVAVLEPAVWLLDEPATALDAGGRARLFDLMAAEARRGAAVVVASEDADAMAPVADRLIVLERGRPVLDGRPGDVLSGDAVWDTGAGGTAYAAIARSAGRLVASPRLAPPYPLELGAAVARWS